LYLRFDKNMYFLHTAWVPDPKGRRKIQSQNTIESGFKVLAKNKYVDLLLEPFVF